MSLWFLLFSRLYRVDLVSPVKQFLIEVSVYAFCHELAIVNSRDAVIILPWCMHCLWLSKSARLKQGTLAVDYGNGIIFLKTALFGKEISCVCALDTGVSSHTDLCSRCGAPLNSLSSVIDNPKRSPYGLEDAVNGNLFNWLDAIVCTFGNVTDISTKSLA